jgi:hypothetical protein
MQNPLYLAEPMGPVSLAIAAYMPVNGTTFRVIAGQTGQPHARRFPIPPAILIRIAREARGQSRHDKA